MTLWPFLVPLGFYCFYRFIVVTLETKLKTINILAVPYTETSSSPSPSRSRRMIIKGYNLWLPCKLQ